MVEAHVGPQSPPQAPISMLPTSTKDFKQYRLNAKLHGPLARFSSYPYSQARPDAVHERKLALDLSQLPPLERLFGMRMTDEEMEAIHVRCRVLEYIF